MYPFANKYGRASTCNARTAVDHARALLEAALTASGDDTRAVAMQFERLAREVQSVLDLTSEIVDCIQQDWLASIVPMARALGAAARHFIEERINLLSAISDGFTNETKMLEDLLSLTSEQRSIAREGWALRVLATIEAAQLAGAGGRFECMARELDEFSAMVLSGAAEVQTEAEQRRMALIERRRKLNLVLQHRAEHFNAVEAKLSDSIGAMDTALVDFARITNDFQQCVALISSNIAKVVEAIQMQDITRQQIEHVRDMLFRTTSQFENRNGHRHEARLNAILKVQTFQVQNAHGRTKEWIDQVRECLESILRVGSSDVLAIGTKILEQERALSTQISHFERLEQECAADDAEIEASLRGIGELMRITRTHLDRSELARDRMQLLNFNSMIEACHLGDAAAVLEITRNIGLVSINWSALTDRSSEALEAMLSSSASAERAHRTQTRLSLESLGNARHESNVGLVALSRAAAIADCNGGKVKTVLIELHDESAALGCTAGRLEHSIALMEEAHKELQHIYEASTGDAAKLTEDDRLQIENECAAIYTSELERRILRAALYGEAMPSDHTALEGNDVELF